MDKSKNTLILLKIIELSKLLDSEDANVLLDMAKKYDIETIIDEPTTKKSICNICGKEKDVSEFKATSHKTLSENKAICNDCISGRKIKTCLIRNISAELPTPIRDKYYDMLEDHANSPCREGFCKYAKKIISYYNGHDCSYDKCALDGDGVQCPFNKRIEMFSYLGNKVYEEEQKNDSIAESVIKEEHIELRKAIIDIEYKLKSLTKNH